MSTNDKLTKILAAREQRAALRKSFFDRKLVSVSLNLNIPGYPKTNLLLKKLFFLLIREFEIFLSSYNVRINNNETVITNDASGDFYITAIDLQTLSVSDLKLLTEKFETEHCIGRLIDVDVVDSGGNTLSSGKAKSCIICKNNAAVDCMRSSRHTYDELRSTVLSLAAGYLQRIRNEFICRRLSQIALKAVLSEISLTPKPGLVDKISSGAHRDMNFQTFVKSSSAISAYFSDLVVAGLRFDKPFYEALPAIRRIGMRMEADMFESTQGVNTQKGIIFLLGISLFSAGLFFKNNDVFIESKFREIVKKICKDLVKNELECFEITKETHGIKMYKNYGVTGARGEAQKGFPMVFEVCLPLLLTYNDFLSDQALQKAFLLISVRNDDTNILYRSNLEVLNTYKKMAMEAIDSTEKYNELIEYCLRKNISPGGSADMLVLTIFFREILNIKFETYEYDF